MASPFPETGAVFEDRYRIESAIGSGGFARVYHAIHLNLRRDVALKILKPRPFEQLDSDGRPTYDDQFVDRFRREARNIAQLRDAHTVTLYDFGRTDGGLFYMVFEYVHGDPLSEIARVQPPIAPRRTVKILRGVLSSLHEAHAVGILHRDIKPDNILVYEHVGRSDQVKVLDFGISKAVLGSSELTLQDLTRQNAMVGTPHFVSPEQLRGEEPGPESDLYSLGLVAYEMVTGERAIRAAGSIDAVNRQISPQPVVVPDDGRAPRNLHATIQRMLAKDPEDRFDSARAVREALEHWDAEYDLEWTPRWLDPPSDTLRAPEPDDLGGLPVGEVAEQRYRTRDRAGRDQITRPMSEIRPLESRGTGRAERTEERGRRRYLELAAVALAAFAVPVVGYFGYSWWLEATPDSAARGASPGAAGRADVDSSETAGYVTFEVRTRPPGAHIKIGHRAVGESPLELRRDHFSFPTSVRAELPDGRRIVRTVERPGGRLVFDFDSALDAGRTDRESRARDFAPPEDRADSGAAPGESSGDVIRFAPDVGN